MLSLSGGHTENGLIALATKTSSLRVKSRIITRKERAVTALVTTVTVVTVDMEDMEDKADTVGTDMGAIFE